jgi:hypothetical protein
MCSIRGGVYKRVIFILVIIKYVVLSN